MFNVPKKCQGDVYEEVCTASCYEEDTDRWDCVAVRLGEWRLHCGMALLKSVIRMRPIFLRAPMLLCVNFVVQY